jgi:hypothetical protein
LFVAMRGVSAGGRERLVFRSHVLSFAMLAVVAGGLLVGGRVSLTVAAGMLAIHALYSLTVLELWSLSEGSYSLTMLARLRGEPMHEAALVAQFSALGERKKNARLKALQEGGLIAGGERLALSPKGRCVAMLVRALRTMANFRDAG